MAIEYSIILTEQLTCLFFYIEKIISFDKYAIMIENTSNKHDTNIYRFEI